MRTTLPLIPCQTVHTYPFVSGTAAAAFVVMAAPGANPRKFAEKIAQHMQKGAEEEAEFRKIMSECAMVKQNPHRVSNPDSVVTPLQSVPPVYLTFCRRLEKRHLSFFDVI